MHNALKQFRQKGHECVKKFSSLLLDIHNISEDDKLFNFMSSLQNWAQIELCRYKVRDLSSAIIVVDGLLEDKGYNDRKTLKSKQPIMDEKIKGKFEKVGKDGRAYDYREHKSNG